MSTSDTNQRLGPIELAPGVTTGNVLVKLLAAFVGIGALSGKLSFWSEVVGLLLFFPSASLPTASAAGPY